MFAASRNIAMSMTSSMVKEHRRRRSSSSGRATPRTRNPSHTRSRSVSPVNFDTIWKDLVTDTRLFPNETKDTNILTEADCQIGRCLFEEGRAHANAGYYERAIELFTQALTAQRSELGEYSPCVARTLVERGNASAAMGELYDSVLDLEKALLIERRLASDDEAESLDVANSYLRVGQIQHKRGNFVEAIHCFECALAIRQRVLGDHDVRVARVIVVLAVAHHQRRKYAKAADYYSQCFAVLKEMHMTKDSPELIWLRRCVADKNLYHDRVERYWEDASAI
mmetsp:Transcript_6110/g.11567  ORF Transcript_6110/g.11567 Transcript_6110/m.11567 type:complete len:282 (+) Transcript_6110:308-1153(+)